MPTLIRQTVPEAVESYLKFRKAQKRAAGTIENDRFTLNVLIRVTTGPNGPILVSSLTGDHIDDTIITLRGTRERSMNAPYSTLRNFLAWARNNQRYPINGPDLMWGRTPEKIPPRERPRVHRRDFARLLDTAESNGGPRDRIIVAMGLYAFLRQSEMKEILIRHVRLDDNQFHVTIKKTVDTDEFMPISQELDRELRKWLTYYTNEVGPLKPDYFLVPSRTSAGMTRDKVTGRWKPYDGTNSWGTLVPLQQTARPERRIQPALKGIGFPVRDDKTGKSLMAGEHTLRRSGARALYEELCLRTDLHDSPKEIVRAMLHHVDIRQTEDYIGLDVHREARNAVIQGQVMFPTAVPTSVVVPIRTGDVYGVGGV